jgi:hypothetical protein
MQERDNYLSQQYHQHLLDIVAAERLAYSAQGQPIGRLDHLLDRSGDLLIAMGQRLKNHTAAPDLTSSDLGCECP